ncbi:MAG: SUF system NifU family Fe-S cluster assembly protein [Gallionellales bacterium 35-53-114]|jgi:nitrogen fixation NifU-like protein|nr:MAG: SUF system NifU family Fe-S cluster assembly protein [Gallionellales bacterium 35-53-114]OYZ64162.1 MAG: SUF system NifU family Fe-S cluster assembly protein [Gallionellales bacterium 24-53-125]OZB10529.1 MAG: SUF system NifU family Fe-S cluster assembly protein [Gallionellales bacterium 39-52-133]HQS57149.1 SUF system NifU family Fe-S cluster assembly protein [Gallionellaceae bacterium]HQS74663.1 SUF system NifU family Fe-S cluster assembly protein [Gallionellaceae bacterium]
MADMKALYQEVIMDHNKKPRNFGKLSPATHHAEGHNPLCGDHINIYMNLAGDKVKAINFEGEACAVCKSSASMMTVAVKGKTRAEAETLTQDFLSMATGKMDMSAPNNMGRLAVFAGVRDLPTRVKCAILPWHTLHAAFNSVTEVSTEADADPMHSPMGNA